MITRSGGNEALASGFRARLFFRSCLGLQQGGDHPRIPSDGLKTRWRLRINWVRFGFGNSLWARIGLHMHFWFNRNVWPKACKSSRGIFFVLWHPVEDGHALTLAQLSK